MKFSRLGSRAILATLLTFATGCGTSQNSDGDIGGDHTDIRPKATLPDAQASAQLTQVSCFSEQDCNPNVGMIAATWTAPAPGVSVCTGFLVAPDILATNSHCLPSDLDQSGASCAQRLWVFFPSTSDFSAEKQECDTVISSTGHSEDYPPKQDIAFLRLKAKTTRPGLELSRAGFPDQSTFRLVKVNPQEGPGGGFDIGTMQTVECQAEQHSSRLPTFDDDHSPVVSLATCEVILGNSGSPLLDGDGRVAGIIQAFFKPAKVDQEALLADHVSRLNVATSMACINAPTPTNDDRSPLPAACAELPGRDSDTQHAHTWTALVTRKMDVDSQTAFNDALEATTGVEFIAHSLDADSPLIGADQPHSEYDDYVAPIPSCAEAAQPAPSTSVRLSILHYRKGYDEFLIPAFRPAQPLQANAQLTLTPQGQSGFDAELDATDSRGGTTQLFHGQIPFCR